MNTNITGAPSDKRTEIMEIAKSSNSDVICITETWCSPSVPNEAVTLNGYVANRTDRKDGRSHGGIICYVRGGIPVVNEWEELDAKDLETLWITIRPQHMAGLYVK